MAAPCGIHAIGILSVNLPDRPASSFPPVKSQTKKKENIHHTAIFPHILI